MNTPNPYRLPIRIFICLTGSALILSLTILMLSTHIRLGEAGLGCSPWPQCYAQLSFADGIKGLQIPDSEFRTFRAMHRYVASLLGVNILVILLLALRYRRVIAPGLPALMFLVVIFLSVIGMTTPTRSLPVVTFGNILGGIVLSGLIWRQLLRMRSRRIIEGHFVLYLLSATLTLQLISGAWASANYTGSACPELLTCSHTENIKAHITDSLNPLRRLTLDENDRMVIDTSSSIIQYTHRLIAIVMAIVVLISWRLASRHYPHLRGAIRAVVMVFVAEFALGIFNVLADMPLWTNTLHNLMAVLLLFSVINLTMQVRNHSG